VPPKRARFGRTQKALLAGTVATLGVAAALAAVVVFTGGSRGSAPQTPLAAPPPSTTTVTTTAPSPSEESSAPSTTTITKSPSPTAAVTGLSDVDAQGFVGHAARCDAGSQLAAAIRTASSLAVVCEAAPGSYYYHGERLSDGANLQIADATPVDGGFDATNPADGARYQVRPDELTISSNGHVDSAEAALEYGAD
jgi:serine/threonine-protein kinase